MPHIEPRSIRYYQKELAHAVPIEAYRPAYYKLIYMSAHVILIFALIGIISSTSSSWITCGMSILIGISIACLFLYSHELSHGIIIKKKPWAYLAQNFFWAFSGIPPTVWDRVHNHTHHHTMNTPKDPDRKTHITEKSKWNDIYNLFIYPNNVLKYSITIGFAMVFYSLKHTLAVFYKGVAKPAIVTYKPQYTTKEKWKVILEILYILSFWGAIWLIIGPSKGLMLSSISWITYSSLVILFILTQHLSKPLYTEVADPLLTSTSIIIPKWLDKIIDMHSYHVEHHVFPGMNFDYYPAIQNELLDRHPDKYERIPFLQALKNTFENGVYIEDPFH